MINSKIFFKNNPYLLINKEVEEPPEKIPEATGKVDVNLKRQFEDPFSQTVAYTADKIKGYAKDARDKINILKTDLTKIETETDSKEYKKNLLETMEKYLMKLATLDELQL